MNFIRFARNAMGTRFELVLPGEPVGTFRAVAEAALDEIDRVEAQLSRYRSTSQVAHINAQAATTHVKVTPELFALLQRAKLLWVQTAGAFDITLGPVLHLWGFENGRLHLPSAEQLANACALVGMDAVELNEADLTVQFARAGMWIDLGGIGKGYAIDAAVAVLREAGVSSAFIHAGTSTIFALGAPPDANAWKVAILGPPEPQAGGDTAYTALGCDRQNGPRTALCVAELRDNALSVSAVWGRYFLIDGRAYGHIIDPRTGLPVQNTLLGAVICQNATEADALSTALVVLGAGGMHNLACAYPGIRMLTVANSTDGSKLCISTVGLDGRTARCRELAPAASVAVRMLSPETGL